LPLLKFQPSYFTVEEGADRPYRNVGNQIPTYSE